MLNEGEVIVDALAALQTFRKQGHEIIVVDGGSKDNTFELSKPLCDICLESAQGRSLQMNAGATVASHSIFLFLHADTHLPVDAVHAVINGLKKRDWGRFNLSIADPGKIFRIIETAINWRSALTGVATGDQAIFVTRALFEKCGGFPELPLMEDIAFSKQLRKICWPACLSHRVTTSARRWKKHGILKTIFLMWVLRFRYFIGASPDQLLAKYYPNHQRSSRYRYLQSRIIVFTKEPVVGRVKTRLIPALGEEKAKQVHEQLLSSLLGKLKNNSVCPVELWVNGNSDSSIFKNSGFPVHKQCGNDLGEIMADASTKVLARSEQVILIGSDCPDMDVEYLKKAFESLEVEDNDGVIGPAEDGGYVLLGFKKIEPQIFQNIPWGGNDVLEKTEDLIAGKGLKFIRLLTLADVDRPEDLIHIKNSDIV